MALLEYGSGGRDRTCDLQHIYLITPYFTVYKHIRKEIKVNKKKIQCQLNVNVNLRQPLTF